MKKCYMLVLLVSMFIAKGSYACTESWDCRMNPPCASCVSYANSIANGCHDRCLDTTCCRKIHPWDPCEIDNVCLASCYSSCDADYCTDIQQCEDYFYIANASMMTPDTPCKGAASYTLKPAV